MGLMTQKDLAQQGSVRINEFLAESKLNKAEAARKEEARVFAQNHPDPTKEEEGLGDPMAMFTPVAGDIMDVGRAVGSATQGDWGGAALGMVAAIPLVGDGLKASLKSRKGIGGQAGSATTQVATTAGSYKKAVAKALEINPKGKTVLDYGAGLGLGTDAMRETSKMKVTSYEPFPERWKGTKPVDYTDSAKINTKFDTVVNLNVLNVLEPELREVVAKDLMSKVKEGGVAIVGTRGWKGDVNAAKKATAATEDKALWIHKSSGDVYQKGFDGDELKDYMAGLAPEGYRVEKGKGIANQTVYIHNDNKIAGYNEGGLVDNEMETANFNHGGDVHGKADASDAGAELLRSIMSKYKGGDYAARDSREEAFLKPAAPADAALIEMVAKHKRKKVEQAEAVPQSPQYTFGDSLSSAADQAADKLSVAGPALGAAAMGGASDALSTVTASLASAAQSVSGVGTDLASNAGDFLVGSYQDYKQRDLNTRTRLGSTYDDEMAGMDLVKKEVARKGADTNIVESIHTVVRQQENGVRAGWTEKTGKWLPHPSVEGGIDTIGYGHKFATQEEADAMAAKGGITEEEAQALFKVDMAVAEARAKKAYENKYEEREWDSLDTLGKLMLSEIAFNTGTLLENGVYNWPNLTKAIHDKDYKAASKQLNRTYTREDGTQISLRERTDALRVVYESLLPEAGWSTGNTQAAVDKTDWNRMIA